MAPAPTNPTVGDDAPSASAPDEDDDEARGAVDTARATRRCARRLDARATTRGRAGATAMLDMAMLDTCAGRTEPRAGRVPTDGYHDLRHRISRNHDIRRGPRPCSVQASSRARGPRSVTSRRRSRVFRRDGDGTLRARRRRQRLPRPTPRGRAPPRARVDVPLHVSRQRPPRRPVPRGPPRGRHHRRGNARGCSRRPGRGPLPHRPRPPRALGGELRSHEFPAACERDPASALATNVPTALLDALDAAWSAGELGTSRPLLVHLSTDQVYGGDDAMSVEATHPPDPSTRTRDPRRRRRRSFASVGPNTSYSEAASSPARTRPFDP